MSSCLLSTWCASLFLLAFACQIAYALLNVLQRIYSSKPLAKAEFCILRILGLREVYYISWVAPNSIRYKFSLLLFVPCNTTRTLPYDILQDAYLQNIVRDRYTTSKCRQGTWAFLSIRRFVHYIIFSTFPRTDCPMVVILIWMLSLATYYMVLSSHILSERIDSLAQRPRGPGWQHWFLSTSIPVHTRTTSRTCLSLWY